MRVLRKGGGFGVAKLPLNIRLDGRVAGVLEPDSEVQFTTTPGNHILEIRRAEGVRGLFGSAQRMMFRRDGAFPRPLKLSVTLEARQGKTFIMHFQAFTGPVFRTEDQHPWSVATLGQINAIFVGAVSGIVAGATLGIITRPAPFGFALPLSLLFTDSAADKPLAQLLSSHLSISGGIGAAVGMVAFYAFAATRR